MSAQGKQFEQEVVSSLRDQVPFADLPGVRVSSLVQPADQPFDVRFELESGGSRILVYGEIKPAFTPKSLEQIAPWIARLKDLEKDTSFAVICPLLSPQAQAFCFQNGIDFIDLAGNISINVPGKFVLRRTGVRGKEPRASEMPIRDVNVYSGRSSRVLRVLLQRQRRWTLTEIAKEIAAETQRNPLSSPEGQAIPLRFNISLGAISKAIATLEEQLWVRRRGSIIFVPEPKRLLVQWAEKYKERFRWRLRSSFRAPNPFGVQLAAVNRGLQQIESTSYAFTGAAVTIVTAPFIDLDTIDIFLAMPKGKTGILRCLQGQQKLGPDLRFISPYDIGVFMYAREEAGIPLVSGIQAYLDLYGRGGRDLKQAEYLLRNRIEPAWSTA